MDLFGSVLCLVSSAAKAARVEMYENEDKAEAAYSAMYDAPSHGVKDYHDDAQMYFNLAIKAARRARLHSQAKRLTLRSEQVQAVFNSQFRYSR